MRYAQIQDNRVHWIFESDEPPDFAPYITIVSLEGHDEVQEGWDYTDGVFSEHIIPFSTLASAKRAEIWGAGDALLAQVKANFTEAEIESWSKQEQGAKDIQAGNTDTDAALFVASIAARRGITAEELVTKILGNVASYGALSAAVIGEQQRLDDLIKAAEAAEDREALAAVEWTFDPFAEAAKEENAE